MTKGADEEAWGDFWSRGDRQDGRGCLPDGARGVEGALRDAWHAVARSLPSGARVLDLATGDGRVLRWLGEVRSDLELTGIDSAPTLPAAPQGITLYPAIAMERVPFADAAFDAVVSQFGFEYGEPAVVAGEIARVLRPGGGVALVTHRDDGPILAHNLDRRMEIGWIFDRKALFSLARSVLGARGNGFATTPMAVMQVVGESRQRFGDGSVAWELSEAVRQALMMPGETPEVVIAAAIERIERSARSEMQRIEALQRACATARQLFSDPAIWESAGLALDGGRVLYAGSDELSFADFTKLTRAR